MKNLNEYGFNTENNVYVIAEIGINHSGNIETAKKLIKSAAKTGADAVKFQTYIAEKRVKKNSPIYQNLKKCELPFEAFEELKNYSEDIGIEYFSTPFDKESVDFLNSIGVNLYKVASFHVVNHKLLSQIADTKKTIIMSVGMANLEEIKQAYEILQNRTRNIALLHCISSYPTNEVDANLATVQLLSNHFNCVIGQSDHTPNINVPLYAVAAGAQVIEKHYRVDEKMKCADAAVSITEKQMKQMIDEIRRIEKIFGIGALGLRKVEESAKTYRRFSSL